MHEVNIGALEWRQDSSEATKTGSPPTSDMTSSVRSRWSEPTPKVKQQEQQHNQQNPSKSAFLLLLMIYNVQFMVYKKISTYSSIISTS